MPPCIDLTGQTFTRLTVLERAPNNRWNFACWRCSCMCGTVVVVSGAVLRKGHTKSCGCLFRDTRVQIGRNWYEKRAPTRIRQGQRTRMEKKLATNLLVRLGL